MMVMTMTAWAPMTATDSAGGECELLTVYRRCELFECWPVITSNIVGKVTCYCK